MKKTVKKGILIASFASLLGAAVACTGMEQEEGDHITASVRDPYAKLSKLTATTVPASATTEILSTGKVRDIANKRYFDLVSFQPHEQTKLETALKLGASGESIAYKIEFVDRDHDHEGSPTAIPEDTLREVWYAAQGTATSTKANAVPLEDDATYVRYRVDLTLGGESRSYNALMIIDGDTVILDPVLWMMNRVAAEERPGAEPQLAAYNAVLHEELELEEALQCEASEWVNPTPQVDSQRGTDWHITGFHRAFSSSNYKCTCDTSCVSTCTPLGKSEATEEGVFTPQPGAGWWHASNSERNDVPGTGQPGAGSSCDSAGGALVRNCLFGVFCDVDIGFQAGPVGIAVTIPSGVYPASVWVKAKTALRGTCAPCTQVGGDEEGEETDEPGPLPTPEPEML